DQKINSLTVSYLGAFAILFNFYAIPQRNIGKY
ncbi:MAG: hypothetical protein ACI9QN_001470, partial [Arcticibacterium sp.]